MKHSGPPKVVYIVANSSLPADADTARLGEGTGHAFGQEFGPALGRGAANTPNSGNVSAHKSGGVSHEKHAEILGRGQVVPRFDPVAVHREFPQRWQAYIRANFRNLLHVQQVFGVSERAARKWWNGEGGVNAGYVAVAKREHPVQAERMLFAAE